MKKKILSKSCLAFLLSLALILSVFSPVQAAEFPSGWPQGPEIAEETGILMEATTGQVLFDKDRTPDIGKCKGSQSDSDFH